MSRRTRVAAAETPMRPLRARSTATSLEEVVPLNVRRKAALENRKKLTEAKGMGLKTNSPLPKRVTQLREDEPQPSDNRTSTDSSKKIPKLRVRRSMIARGRQQFEEEQKRREESDLSKKLLKLRLRRSMIVRGRQKFEEEQKRNDERDQSREAGRRSFRLEAAGDSPLTPPPRLLKRKSMSTPRAMMARRPIKIVIRKSAVHRAREKSAERRMETPEMEEDEPIPRGTSPLKCREIEFETIDRWIEESQRASAPLAVYISGSPGTGKTHTLRLVLEKWAKRAASAIINCVAVKVQKDLIAAIFASQEHTGRPSLSELEKFLTSLKKPLILVLDEIDHLASKSNSLLYAAFKWPQQMTTKLMVIGIANSIDLTERLLPKLKLSQPPKTLVFAPYSKDNIREILEKKMSEEDAKMDPKAVELCARKVAGMSGDLRTALHVVKTSQASVRSAGAVDASSECRQVLGVLNTVYSSSLTRARLPLQPCLLLAVCLCMSSNKKRNLTMNSMFAGYVKACEAVKVPPLESDDLSAAFQTLESQSFINTTSNGQIRLQVDSKTARAVISDNAMIEQIGLLNI